MAPKDVFGRDALIRNIWRGLDRQSVVLGAERRMGKTSVIKKMVTEAPPGKLPIYHDLEGIRTPLEFVERVFHDVERYLGTLQRAASSPDAALSLRLVQTAFASKKAGDPKLLLALPIEERHLIQEALQPKDEIPTKAKFPTGKPGMKRKVRFKFPGALPGQANLRATAPDNRQPEGSPSFRHTGKPRS